MLTYPNNLLSTAEPTWADACRVDRQTLAKLMAEIDDPELRFKVMGLRVAVIGADGHVVEGEAIVLRAVVEQWAPQRWMLLPEPSQRSVEHV